MPLALPIAETQLWLFYPLALVFFALVFRAMRRRQIETGSRSDPRSRRGIALQSIGICLVGLGPIKIVLSTLSPPALAGSLAVVLLMPAPSGSSRPVRRRLARTGALRPACGAITS